MDQDLINAFNQEKQQEAEKAQDQLLDVTLAKGIRNEVQTSSQQTQQALVAAVGTLVKFLEQHEPTVSVKNQPKFPSSISTPDVEAVTQAVKALGQIVSKKETDFTAVTAGLEALNKAIKALPKPNDKVSITNQIDYSGDFRKIQSAILGLDIAPRVQVETPQVNVPALDVSPFTKALEAQKTQDKVDLNDFKAQDLTGDDTFQYVGFVAPEGAWYIIEHDIEANSLRYKFGSKNYKSSWRNFNGHSFKLLNEAINEIQT